MQVSKWENQTVTQPYQVTTIEYEERTEKVEVRVCRMVEERETITVPRRVAKWVPVTVTRMVPRPVVMRLPAKPANSDGKPQHQLAAGTWRSEKPTGTQVAATQPTQHSVLRQTTTEIRKITSFSCSRSQHTSRTRVRRAYHNSIDGLPRRPPRPSRTLDFTNSTAFGRHCCKLLFRNPSTLEVWHAPMDVWHALSPRRAWGPASNSTPTPGLNVSFIRAVHVPSLFAG